jgi:hypothetical protein
MTLKEMIEKFKERCKNSPYCQEALERLRKQPEQNSEEQNNTQEDN